MGMAALFGLEWLRQRFGRYVEKGASRPDPI
jgi:hypothetical protein